MALALIIGVLFTTAYLLLITPTKWLKVEKIETNLGLNKKAIQISDIHIKNLRVKHRVIKNVIEKEKPDYIFLTGDFIDRYESEMDLLKQFLKNITNTDAEVYAVLGNHDRYIDENVIIDVLKEYGVIVLLNESIDKEDHYIIGIDDYCNGFHDIEKSFKNIDEDKTKIILTHDPTIILELERKYDYLMAGHLHGKQVNIPFLFKIKKMGALAEKGIYKGKHKNDYGTLYISKGIGQSRYNIRFFVRSEISIHQL